VCRGRGGVKWTMIVPEISRAIKKMPDCVLCVA